MAVEQLLPVSGTGNGAVDGVCAPAFVSTALPKSGVVSTPAVYLAGFFCPQQSEPLFADFGSFSFSSGVESLLPERIQWDHNTRMPKLNGLFDSPVSGKCPSFDSKSARLDSPFFGYSKGRRLQSVGVPCSQRKQRKCWTVSEAFDGLPSTEVSTVSVSTEDLIIRTDIESENTGCISPKPVASIEREVLEIVGKYPLHGHVRISGAKNAALPVMAGAILASEPVRLFNVPHLGDISRMGQVLSSFGCKVNRGDGLDEDYDCLHIDASALTGSAAPIQLANQLRASFFVIGALVARTGEAQIPLPGGCDIGLRPVELHLRGLSALGAHVELKHGVVYATAPPEGLRGAHIFLDFPSVGATETIIMAGTLAEGETVIQNAAREPEVVDLANFCIAMGARIHGAGTDTITIHGVSRLHGGDYTIIPDRIEAGTMLVAGAITRSPISISPVIADHLAAVIAKLEDIGCQVVLEQQDTLRLHPAARPMGTDIKTMPFPGFPTDMQPQFMALLTVCEGTSVVTESIFENRFRHAAALVRMGANIKVEGPAAIITGTPSLSGAEVTATDLRASAALILAGLAADGTTVVSDLNHLDRGYDRLDAKLRQLRAAIHRVTIFGDTELVEPDL